MIELYIKIVDRIMRQYGYDCWLAETADDLLNRYLARRGMEYVRTEVLR